jgi:hypothetical protein
MGKEKEGQQQQPSRQELPTVVLNSLTPIVQNLQRKKTLKFKIYSFLRGLLPCSFGSMNKAIEGILFVQHKEAEERVKSDRIIIDELNKHTVLLQRLYQQYQSNESPDEDNPSYG